MFTFNVLPPDTRRIIVASAGLVSLESDPDKYAVIKNKRGWDVPGGRTEPGETPLETFARELFEETGCQLLPGAQLIAILENADTPTTGAAIFIGHCTLGNFQPTDEIAEMAFASAEELIERYYGDKDMLRELFEIKSLA